MHKCGDPRVAAIFPEKKTGLAIISEKDVFEEFWEISDCGRDTLVLQISQTTNMVD